MGAGNADITELPAEYRQLEEVRSRGQRQAV